MSKYHEQFLYLADAVGNPVELFNGARLTTQMSQAALCGEFSSIQQNAGCDGLVYQPCPLPPFVSESVLLLDTALSARSGGKLVNLGTGGSALDATIGSTTGSDTNDPTDLPHTGTNYVYLSGDSGNYLSVPDSAALSITGDIEIVVRVAADDWTPTGTQRFVSKWTATANQRSYMFGLETTGTLILNWSDDGVTTVGRFHRSSVATGFTDGIAYWVKVTFDVDNGAAGSTAKFYWAADQLAEPTSWTQLGTDVTLAGVTSIYDGTYALEVGGVSGSNYLAGTVYRAIVRNGIGGSTAFDLNTATDVTSSAATSFTATSGQTVTVNRATSGKKLALVTRPIMLFGTDDYLKSGAAGQSEYQFGTSEFTQWIVLRLWGTRVANDSLMGTRVSGAVPNGIELTTSSATADRVIFGASPTALSIVATASSLGSLVCIAGGRSATAAFLRNGVATTTSTATGWNVSADNAAGIFGIGARYIDSGGNSFSSFEFVAAGVSRRALTAAELDAITTYYASTGPDGWTPLAFAVDNAPWYKSTVPASSEGLGFYIEEWTGLDGAHHARSVSPVGARRGGAWFGPQSHGHRVWKMNVLLIGTTTRGLNYLFRWLEGQLLDCCDPCGSQRAWIREYCPTDPYTDPDDGLVRVERVALLEGPTWEDPPVEESGCYLRRVSFTLGVGDPCMYRETLPAVTETTTATSSGTAATTSLAPAGCGQWVGARVAKEAPSADYGDVAARVLITSIRGNRSNGTNLGLPDLRLSGYITQFGQTFDACANEKIGELRLVLNGMSGWDILVDFAQRSVQIRDPYGTNQWQDGSSLIGAASGFKRWWTIGQCFAGFVVVEPLYAALASTGPTGTVADAVTTWDVEVDFVPRFGCC